MYTLQSKTQLSPDSWLLRFALPAGMRWLSEDPNIPTCIKALFPGGTDESGDPKVLGKSYSPVSHPATESAMELVVKSYEPRPGGGVGAFLCGIEVGGTLQAEVKSQRIMHGSAAVLGRWREVGLIGGGTGIAPLVQIARILLADEQQRTSVRMLSINRREEDILMRDALDRMAVDFPERFTISYSLTAPPDGWSGFTGRGDAAMVAATMPPSTHDGSTMVLVCGTDGFVATWGGPVGRGPKKADGSKGPKVQGPLLGLLATAGYNASEVFKY